MDLNKTGAELQDATLDVAVKSHAAYRAATAEESAGGRLARLNTPQGMFLRLEPSKIIEGKEIIPLYGNRLFSKKQVAITCPDHGGHVFFLTGKDGKNSLETNYLIHMGHQCVDRKVMYEAIQASWKPQKSAEELVLEKRERLVDVGLAMAAAEEKAIRQSR